MQTPRRLKPQYEEYQTHVEARSTAQGNPQVTVSARQDRVLYGAKGEIILRLEDRPIGFRRPAST